MNETMPGLDNEHPSRKPRWGPSVYNPGMPWCGKSGCTCCERIGETTVAKGAHEPASTCPCGEVFARVKDNPECSTCETWRCPQCERWCSWEMGHDCPLCDDCCVHLGACDE